MANYTPNYNLGKPDATDQYGLFRQLFNDNMDIIDENLGGGGGSGNVDDVEVNGVSVLDPVTKIAEITSYEEVTQAEYNALPDDKLSNGIAYFIKDSVNGADGFPPLIYSFEERQVGVWADGKPLYQKSYALPNAVNISNNTNLTTYMSDITSTLERFVFAFGCGTDRKSTSPFYIQFYNSQIMAWATPAFDTNIITVQYTKTTGTAGSGDWTPSGALAVHYSTNEQVIGTWTNGKPLYQKSFAFSPPFSSGNNNLTLNISNAIIRNWEVYVLDNVSDPVTIGEGNEIRVVNANSSRIVVWINNSTLPYLSNGEIDVTVRYTKTTD